MSNEDFELVSKTDDGAICDLEPPSVSTSAWRPAMGEFIVHVMAQPENLNSNWIRLPDGKRRCANKNIPGPLFELFAQNLFGGHRFDIDRRFTNILLGVFTHWTRRFAVQDSALTDEIADS